MDMNKKELVELFMSNERIPRYIYRVNPYSEQVLTAIGGGKIDAIIDWSISEEEFAGYPVVHDLTKIGKNAIVLNCVVHSFPITVGRKFDKAGIRNIDLFSFMKYSGITIEIPYWKGFVESYENRKEEYNAVYEALSDEISRKTYESMISLRCDYDISMNDMFTAFPDNQYFEPFLNLEIDGEVYVDLGGFDGANTLYFAEHYPGYKRIYFFEPEPSAMEAAKCRLSKFDNIKYFQMAASNINGSARFSPDLGASKISDEGCTEIQTARLDDLLENDVTFLKMDVEGSEAACIEGAKDIIKTCHPKLAICVYHKGADIIDIPKQVLSIYPDYRLFLRQYTEGICDLVMFFVP